MRSPAQIFARANWEHFFGCWKVISSLTQQAFFDEHEQIQKIDSMDLKPADAKDMRPALAEALEGMSIEELKRLSISQNDLEPYGRT